MKNSRTAAKLERFFAEETGLPMRFVSPRATIGLHSLVQKLDCIDADCVDRR
jgi:hypothetical protein